MSHVAVGYGAAFGLGPYVAVVAALGFGAALLCLAGRPRRFALVDGAPAAAFREEMAGELSRLADGFDADIAALPAERRGDLAGRVGRLRALVAAAAADLADPSGGRADAALAACAEACRDLSRAIALERIEAADAERARAFAAERAAARPAREAAPAEAAAAAVPPAPPAPRVAASRLREEIAALAARVAAVLPSEGDAFAPLLRGLDSADPARLAALRDEAAVRLARAKDLRADADRRRAELLTLAPRLAALEGGAALAAECAAAAGSPFVSEAGHARLLDAAAALARAAGERRLLAEKEAFCARAAVRLEALGYEVVRDEGRDLEAALLAGEAVDLACPWPGYLVRARLNDRGELATRLVRLVAPGREKAERTEYERTRDREVASAWCADYDRFLAGLALDGVPLEVRIRKEPHEEEILLVADPARREGRERGAAAPSRERRDR